MPNCSIWGIKETPDILTDVCTLLESEQSAIDEQFISSHYFEKTGDSDILMEGYTGILHTIKESTNNFVQGVTKCNNVIMEGISDLSTYMADESYKTMVARLDKVDDISFDIIGYNFRTLDTKRIDLSEISSIIKKYNDLIGALQSNPNDIDEVAKYIGECKAYLGESNMSNVRRSMLGVHEPVPADSITTVSRRYYRGSVACVKFTVDKKYIKKEMELQKKLIKDRDMTSSEIISSLKSFSTLSGYLNSVIVDLNQTNVDLSTPLFRYVGKDVNTSMITLKLTDVDVISSLVTALRLTYSKVVRLQGAVQIMLNERLTAIRDQMYQIKEIVRIVNEYMKTQTLSNSEIVIFTESDQIMESFASQPAIDYTEILLDSVIANHSDMMGSVISRYVMESFAFDECVAVGSAVPMCNALMEAETTTKDRVADFVNKLLSAFRKKVIDYDKRFKPSIMKLNSDGVFKEKAKKYTAKKEVLPYWKVTNARADANLIKQAMTAGANNKNTDDLSYMKTLVTISSVSEWDEKKSQIRGYLLNYFRCHEKDKEQVKKITVSGSEISSKLKTMVNYLTGYDKLSSDLDALGKELSRKVASLQSVNESTLYSTLENCRFVDSDVALLEGFEALLEAEDEKKAGEAVGTDGEKTSPTAVESPDSGNGNNNNNASGTEKDKKESNTGNRYAGIYERFFEMAIAAFMTACEERYIFYINILKDINGGSLNVPSENAEKTEKKETKEAANESYLYTVEKPEPMKGLSMYK